MELLQPLKIAECPFANLPEARGGRWGEGLTEEKMKECVWLLCRMRHSTHNVECRTMPHRVLRVLSLLRPASFFRHNKTEYASPQSCPLASVNATRPGQDICSERRLNLSGTIRETCSRRVRVTPVLDSRLDLGRLTTDRLGFHHWKVHSRAHR